MTTTVNRSSVILAIALSATACKAPEPVAPSFPRRLREAPQLEVEPGVSTPPSDPSLVDPPSKTAFALLPEDLPQTASGRFPTDERVTVEFRDTSLADALKLIAARAGANFVYPTDLDGTISATLRDVTLDQALNTILREGRLELFEHDGVLAVRPLAVATTASRIYRPRTASAIALESQAKALLADGGSVTVDADSNLLLVSGNTESISRIDEWMTALDRAQRMEVLIEARILEVSLNDDFEFGVGLAFEDISAGDTTTRLLSNFLRAEDSFQITTLDPTSDFSGVVRALQSYGRLHVIATPRVLALNQNEARIEITEKIPYIDATATTSGSTSGITTSSVEEVEFEVVGIKLHVTPFIGEDDSITLKIHQEVSEVVDFFQSVPVTDNRLIETRFVTRDRQTIVIGGLMKQRTAEKEDGIPWLMDLPLLGWLFSGTDKQKEKVELLVFITPRIVDAGSISDVNAEFKREWVRKNLEYGQERYQEFLDDVP